MTKFIALLRGINVGGNKMIAMRDLRAMCTDLGLGNVKSLLNSGNLVFQCLARPSGTLESLLESEAKQRLDLHTDFFVRPSEEWKRIIGGNPFPVEARTDPGHLVVMFLKESVDAKVVRTLQAVITGREIVRGEGREVYVVYPDGIGKSRLTNHIIERTLGCRSTGRNWNTVLKLGALTES
jgi:uncharacterized protein (DUF1697 family)